MRGTDFFQRIGNEEGLAAILAAFYEKMSTDTLIGFFFDGKDLKHIAAQQKSFLMRAWGVTPSYAGKSPAQAHASLAPILKGHFDRRLVLLAETLREFKIGEGNIDAWVNFENNFRSTIQHDK